MPVFGNSFIIAQEILGKIGFGREHLQGGIRQRAADLTAAYMAVCNGDNGIIAVSQVLKNNFVIRSKCFSEKINNCLIRFKNI